MRAYHWVFLAWLLGASLSAPLWAADLNQLIPGLYGGTKTVGGFAPSNFDPTGHQGHFEILPGEPDPLKSLNTNIGSQIPLFPISSSVGAFSFAFDENLGTYVSSADTLGPIFAERAETLGKNKANLGVSLAWYTFDRFQGQDLGHFRQTFSHQPSTNAVQPSFEKDTITTVSDIGIDVGLVTIAATYGLLDDLDLGLVVPLVQVKLAVSSEATIKVDPGNTTPFAHRFITVVNGVTNRTLNAHFAASDEASGLGDVVLRAKYRLPKNSIVDWAADLQVQLPTGDRKNFLGTGDTFVKPLLVFSRPIRGIGGKSPITISPHINVGYDVDVEDSHRNAFAYAAGIDLGTKRFTVALDVVGTKLTDGTRQPDGSIIGDHIVNGSIGAKWNIYKGWLVSGNILFPLNNDGLRADVIPTFGVEYDFR